MVNKLKLQKLKELLYTYLDIKQENELFDMKLKWHDKIEDLIKDIICFSNTVHDRDCHLFFGISDDFQIIGLNDTKKIKQADIVDTMSKLHFSGSERPSFEVNTILVEGKEIDVLAIFNNDKTPIFLEKPYGKMKAGCIYTRERDRNTPDKGNATFSQIEALWKKRFGLIKPKKEFFFDLLENKNNWHEFYPEYYNIFMPEYRLKVIGKDSEDRDEFYSTVMTNKKTSYYQIDITYNSNYLATFEGVELDSGRLFIPTPRWGYIYDKEFPLDIICRYKYYIQDAERFKLLKFFYDPSDDEQRCALRRLMEIFLLFKSDEERFKFEEYVTNKPEWLDEVYSSRKEYGYLEVSNEHPNYSKTKTVIEDLRYSKSLKLMLEKWRHRDCESFSIN